MEELIIRKATFVDIQSIVQVSLTSTSKEETKGFAAPEWTTYLIAKGLKKIWTKDNKLKDGSEIIIVEKGINIIGFIVFKREIDHVYIDHIDITKKEQRKGIGRTLVTYVEKIAINAGYSCVKTDTTENAEGTPWKSYHFWIKMGFKDTGERLSTNWTFKTIPFIKNLF